MRSLFTILVLFAAGSVLVRDIDLVMAYTRRELVHFVVDREENGVVTKAHATQMPSPEEAPFFMVWIAINLGFAGFCYSCLLRRSGFRRKGFPRSQDPVVGIVASRPRGTRPVQATHWVAFAVCQIAGIVCLAIGTSMPPKIAMQMVSFIVLIPGSFIINLSSAPQLGGAIAFNFATWLAARKWKDLSAK